MALILSIPEMAHAATTYYSYGDHEITYNNYLYGFYITSDPAYDLPSDYKISSEVFEDIILSDAKGLQFDLANRIDTFGVKILEWYANGLDSYLNFVYGTFVNAYQATNSFVHDFIWSGATTYSWNYYFTGADPNYPGSGDYGTAYGFRFIGAGGEKFDIVLDANGDYYGHSIIGNWTPSEAPAPTNWILINQGLDNFYTPSVSAGSFNDLKRPYISGKSLHFFYYDNNVEHEVVISDFTECILYVYSWLNSYPAQNPAYACSAYNFSYADSSFTSFTVTDNNVVQSVNNSTGWTNYSGIHGSFRSTTYQVNFSSSGPNVNLPVFYLNRGNINNGYRVSNPNFIGIYNQNFVSGTGDLWLNSFSYTPQTTPQPFPEEPVPITSIPEDPDDPIPDSEPDPVPGIEYPVNPTPPPLRPVPSIVSGNDDLWPSVVQLQDIEFDLSGYLSSLGGYQFPDLSIITESFAGSIVWVSGLMTTLFNGSEFSILFAVLSSFFIVAALLGLYKWWNHK